MHIKFLARGTGAARAAADYLLGARDATGQPRAGVEVIRGDPRQVADALAFEHKYTSGVIAWAPDDAPTDAQTGTVRDAFDESPFLIALQEEYAAWHDRLPESLHDTALGPGELEDVEPPLGYGRD